MYPGPEKKPGYGNPSKAHYPSVGIILVNWNGWQDTLDCLASLSELDYPNFSVVVVDNGSSNDSVSRIRQAYPHVNLLETGENLGFAGGNNKGIAYAMKRRVDFVWLLNNDTEVHPKALSSLVAEAQSGDVVGIVGSKIYYYDTPDTLWFAGGTVNRWTTQTGHVGMGKTDLGQWDTSRDVDYVSGCSMLVSREVIEDVGVLDARYFLYFEETDWATRAIQKGWRVRYQPGSKVWHKVSKSAGLNSPVMIFHFSKSSMLYAKKHMPSRLPFTALVLIRHHVLPFLARGKLATAAAGLRGLKTGLIT